MCVVCKSDECAGTSKLNVIYEIPRNTSNCLWDNLLWAWSAQHSTIMIYYSKMRGIHKNMYIRHHILNVNAIHSIKLTKWPQPISETSHISNHHNNSKIKKTKAINMKYYEKNEKPLPFLEVWRRKDDENGGFLSETRWVVREMNGQDNEQ